MKNKLINASIFILSTISLLISFNLFWNMAVFVDEFNTTPSVVLGGDFWLYMDWLRMGISAIICILSSLNIFNIWNKSI